MSFPTAKVHRVSRRHLGRGQSNVAMGISVTAGLASQVVTLTFSNPVVVTGRIPLSVAGGTFVSQAIVSPTQVSQTFTGSISSSAWSVPSMAANVKSYQGGAVAGATGTF